MNKVKKFFRDKKKRKLFFLSFIGLLALLTAVYVSRKGQSFDIRNYASYESISIEKQYINADKFFIQAKVRRKSSKTPTHSYFFDNNQVKDFYSNIHKNFSQSPVMAKETTIKLKSNPVNTCKTNADCVVVNKPFSCCFDVNGEIQAVNKDYYDSRAEKQCHDDLVCANGAYSPTDKAICYNSQCQLADKVIHSCKTNSDCIVVNKPFSCCFDVNEEIQAVNKNYYKNRVKKQCPKNLMCANETTATNDKAICYNSQCRLASRVVNTCKTDKDCVVVNKPFSCCFDINGKKQAVNKGYYKSRFEKQCPDDLVCANGSYSATDKAICKNSKCIWANKESNPKKDKSINALRFIPVIDKANSVSSVAKNFCVRMGGKVKNDKCVMKTKSFKLNDFMCSCLSHSEQVCSKSNFNKLEHKVCPNQANDLNRSITMLLDPLTDSAGTSFDSKSVLLNTKYHVTVQGCSDQACSVVLGSNVKSKVWILQKPYINAVALTKDTCNTNAIQLIIKKTNVKSVKVIVYNNKRVLYKKFKALEERDNYYKGTFSIPKSSGPKTMIKIFACDNNNETSCNLLLKLLAVENPYCANNLERELQ